MKLVFYYHFIQDISGIVLLIYTTIRTHFMSMEVFHFHGIISERRTSYIYIYISWILLYGYLLSALCEGIACYTTNSSNLKTASTPLCKGEHHMHRANRRSNSISTGRIHPDDNRSWWYQAMQFGIWSRPIRPWNRIWKEGCK